MTRLILLVLGLAVWWLLVPLGRFLAADGWRMMSAGLPLLAVFIGVLVACFRFRNRGWIVFLWSPLFALSLYVLVELTISLAGEMSVQVGGEPAPLEGVAVLLGIAICLQH